MIVSSNKVAGRCCACYNKSIIPLCSWCVMDLREVVEPLDIRIYSKEFLRFYEIFVMVKV